LKEWVREQSAYYEYMKHKFKKFRKRKIDRKMLLTSGGRKNHLRNIKAEKFHGKRIEEAT